MTVFDGYSDVRPDPSQKPQRRLLPKCARALAVQFSDARGRAQTRVRVGGAMERRGFLLEVSQSEAGSESCRAWLERRSVVGAKRLEDAL
ncbi:hypothetical protein NDU88_000274 [Pleurodeles waltl]|uniref:Uncharacterized protein n=1 Tax=Pleurodeles waltl TaxID=8319 RepID=A0AAV7SW47_PLEWA|nr:hypothetical protein NDU88_000274 [Pleurodeles waltl]